MGRRRPRARRPLAVVAISSDDWLGVLAFLTRLQLIRVQLTTRLIAHLVQQHFPERPYACVRLKIWSLGHSPFGAALNYPHLMAGVDIVPSTNHQCQRGTKQSATTSSMWKFFCPDKEEEKERPALDEHQWLDDCTAMQKWRRIVCVYENNAARGEREGGELRNWTKDANGTTRTVWKIDEGPEEMLQGERQELYTDRGIWMRHFVRDTTPRTGHHTSAEVRKRRSRTIEHCRLCSGNSQKLGGKLLISCAPNLYDASSGEDANNLRMELFEGFVSKLWRRPLFARVMLMLDDRRKRGRNAQSIAELVRRLDVPFVRVVSVTCLDTVRDELAMLICTLLHRLFSSDTYQNVRVQCIFSKAHMLLDASDILRHLRMCAVHFGGWGQQEQLLAQMSNCCATLHCLCDEDEELCPSAMLVNPPNIDLHYYNNVAVDTLVAMIHSYNPKHSPERIFEFSVSNQSESAAASTKRELIERLLKEFCAAQSALDAHTYRWRTTISFSSKMLTERRSAKWSRNNNRIYTWRDVLTLIGHVQASHQSVQQGLRQMGDGTSFSVHLHNVHSGEHWRVLMCPTSAVARHKQFITTFQIPKEGQQRYTWDYMRVPINEGTKFGIDCFELVIWRYGDREQALHARLSEQARLLDEWHLRCSVMARALGNADFDPLLLWGKDTDIRVVEERAEIREHWTDYASTIWLLGWAELDCSRTENKVDEADFENATPFVEVRRRKKKNMLK